MKRLVFLLALLASAVSAQTIGPVWQKVSDLYINTEPARQYIGPLFANSYSGAGMLPNQWNTIDLTAHPWNLPTDARFAFLSGILIITYGVGGATNTADLGLVLRKLGDTRVTCTPANYMGQAVEATPGNGIRTNMATWVALSNGRLEACWTKTTPGNFGDESPSYGVNLSVQAWAR